LSATTTTRSPSAVPSTAIPPARYAALRITLLR
jgi:hypothetical protein